MALKDKIKIIDRRLIKDHRGWFLKVIDGKEENLPAYTGEIYLTMGVPGQTKGAHYHPVANEWFTIIEGSATLLLEDMEDHDRMNLKLHFEDAKTIYVPHGIAHAFKNDSDSNFILLAYTDFLYDPTDTIPFNF